jgi:hypothetical protein
MEAIRAKVAEILTDYQLALNVGRLKGVERGATVTIYRTVEISDPDTHEPLGQVTVPKLTLRVVDVQELLCVAEVTERVGADDTSLNVGFILTSAWKPLKRIATSKGFDDSSSIWIQAGDAAVIQLRETATE